jgi:hypothetical protein
MGGCCSAPEESRQSVAFLEIPSHPLGAPVLAQHPGGLGLFAWQVSTKREYGCTLSPVLQTTYHVDPTWHFACTFPPILTRNAAG